MDIASIKAEFVTVPEIARDCGQKTSLVHSWLKYHRYMPFEHILERPAVRRSDYERFKQEHPELIKTSVATQ